MTATREFLLAVAVALFITAGRALGMTLGDGE